VARVTPERDTTLTTYDRNGHKQRDHVLRASGVHEYATYAFDGSLFRTVIQLDGSYQTVARDEAGESVTTLFNAAGAKLSDNWSRADGSTGSASYSANGTWTAIATYSDGARSTSTGDAAGTTTARHFSAAGAFLGTTITHENQGGFESTTFNAAGVKTNAAWVHPDGASAEYVYQSTGSFTGTVSRVDGSHDALSGTAQGVVTIAHFNAAGGLISTSVNHAPVASATTLTSNAHVGQAFTLALPEGTMADSDTGDVLSYTASLSGSAYLPDWISFDPVSRTLSGTPVSSAMGSVAIQVTATDLAGASASKLLTIQVAGLRSAPIAAQAAIEDQAWTFQVPGSAFIAQGQVGTVIYEASLTGGANLPSWLAFDSATRTFSGTPLNRDVGKLSVSVKAVDTYGSAAESRFSLAIANTNDAPEAWIPLDDQETSMGEPLALTIPADAFRDMDPGDSLRLSARLSDGSPLPGWMTFEHATRRLLGTAPAGEASTFQLAVLATDGAGLTATSTFTLSLVAGNRAPVVAHPIADQQVEMGAAWTFSVPPSAFVDGDTGDTLAYTAQLADGSALPAWLNFDAATRTFSGTPERQDIRAIDVLVRAVDGAGDAASDSFTLAVVPAPDLTILGTPAADVLFGRAGNDTIDGLAGADAMSGGLGDDSYSVDDAGDAVFENPGAGTDTVKSSVSHTLAPEVENLVLLGDGAINGNGNVLDNALDGNAAGNVLDGGAGADLLRGGRGDDVYFVDDRGDAVVENAREGLDTVYASVDYALPMNVDNLVLTGAADVGAIGNELANRLQGNTGNNFLDGAGGGDFMAGALGNDSYVVDSSEDRVFEQANEGFDTVYSAITYSLGANVENLVLTGASGIGALGNAQDNRIQGNAAMNTLDGGAGADSMQGGAGDDTYFVDNVGDIVIENPDEGLDTVFSQVNFSLGASVENLLLTGAGDLNGSGNALANRMQGNAGSNILDGGAGADVLLGGAGNDVYLVDDLRDVTVELANEGSDTVFSSVTYTLPAQLENLVLTGNVAIGGSGNELANRLQGNAAGNVLDGGAGADVMLGGTGDDTFIVDNVNDLVNENAGEGVDTVRVGTTYVLGANLENVVLTGTASVDAYGNSLDNALKGNGAGNALVGGGGNDSLDGSGGADLLVGGAGDDTYYLNRGSGADLVVEWGGSLNDVAQFGSGIAADQLWFSRSGSNLIVQVIGTSDSMTMRNWYGSPTSILISFANQLISSPDSITNWFAPSGYRTDWFKTSDGRALQESQVQNLVNAMASFAPPAAGQTTLSPQYQSALSATIAANWH
jgi:Ca2+-binding RTX toxin-like protein